MERFTIQGVPEDDKCNFHMFDGNLTSIVKEDDILIYTNPGNNQFFTAIK